MADNRKITTQSLAKEMSDYFAKQRANAPTPQPSRLATREQGALGAASIERQMANVSPNRATLTMPTGPVVGFSNVFTPDPQDVRDPVTGLTPAQAAARANAEAVAKQTGGTIDPRTGMITPPAGPTGPRSTGPTGPTGPGSTGPTGPAGVDPAITALLAQLQQQNLQAQLAAQAEADRRAAEAQAARQSAYDLLLQQFSQYGLASLVEPLKGLITSGINPSEFTIRLRETDAYKKRFAANQARIGKGLRALSEAEYIDLEDAYQDIMVRYGLPKTYFERGDMGIQQGFEKLIGGNVSPVELENRVSTAYNRVFNAAPDIQKALREFYPEIGNGDILAYVLDPENAVENIKRKVTAAEIGGAATLVGLGTARTRAEELQRFGVTGEQARQGFTTISEFLPQAQVLGERYAKQGLGPFTQETAEAEVFATPGAAEAGRKRRKLTELEQAQFAGSSGMTGGALGRERAGAFQAC